MKLNPNPNASTEPQSTGATTIPFGQYRGLTIDYVAQSDDGLRYLDWLVGVANPGQFKDELVRYLEQPAIAREVERLVGED